MAADIIRRAERGAEIGRQIVESINVRPHQSDIVGAADLLDFVLALYIASFREARGDQHGAGNALFATFRRVAATNLAGIANTATSMSPGTSFTDL